MDLFEEFQTLDQEGELLRSKKRERSGVGRPKGCTITAYTDLLCYMVIDAIREERRCSFWRSCQIFAEERHRHEKTMARAAKRGYKVFLEMNQLLSTARQIKQMCDEAIHIAEQKIRRYEEGQRKQLKKR